MLTAKKEEWHQVLNDILPYSLRRDLDRAKVKAFVGRRARRTVMWCRIGAGGYLALAAFGGLYGGHSSIHIVSSVLVAYLVGFMLPRYWNDGDVPEEIIDEYIEAKAGKRP